MLELPIMVMIELFRHCLRPRGRVSLIRNNRYLFSAFIFLIIGASAFAQDLTLRLEEPSLNNAAQQPQVKAKTEQKKTETVKQVSVKIGKVGLVNVASTSIYKNKSTSSAKFTTVGAETPLAVVKEEKEWYGVLMANGAIGWVRSKNVKMSGYELVMRQDADARQSNPGLDLSKSNSWASDLLRTALNYSGVRYVYGGTNPSSGMDCSAFVRMVFSQYSIPLPRTAREQAQVGITVPFDQLQPGDRLYFQCKYPYIDHCGIYAGNGYFIHCNASKNGVSVDTLENFYLRSLVIAKRS